MKDDLDELLEAERRLAVRLDEARATAAGLLDVARADAEALARRAEADERTGRERIAQQTQVELEAELGRIASRGDARVQLYTGLPESRVRELSLDVLRALLEEGPAVRP